MGFVFSQVEGVVKFILCKIYEVLDELDVIFDGLLAERLLT